MAEPIHDDDERRPGETQDEHDHRVQTALAKATTLSEQLGQTIKELVDILTAEEAAAVAAQQEDQEDARRK